MDHEHVKPEALFTEADEREFKRAFVISFMAADESERFDENCSRGWKNHRTNVEDAADLARRAWDEWCETIGVGK